MDVAVGEVDERSGGLRVGRVQYGTLRRVVTQLHRGRGRDRGRGRGRDRGRGIVLFVLMPEPLDPLFVLGR